jgi:hypothetical protein
VFILATHLTLTLDTYSHVLPSMQQAASDKLERICTGEDYDHFSELSSKVGDEGIKQVAYS